jgi:hypothetical protein
MTAKWDKLIDMPPDELAVMARQRAFDLKLDPSSSDHRMVINMLRHDYTNYDGQVVNSASDRLYNEILDAIAHDFPWLADQCAKDKATHFDRQPDWVHARRYARQYAVERQRRGRAAIKSLSVGTKVVVNWRGLREAEIIEVRRSRVKAQFPLNDGTMYVIDRPADEVQLLDESQHQAS